MEHFNLQKAAWNSSLSYETHDSKLSYSNEIIEKVAAKRRLRKQWQLSRCPHIKNKLNRLIKDLKRYLDTERNLGVQNYLQQLNATKASNYSLWKATKKLKQPKRYLLLCVVRMGGGPEVIKKKLLPSLNI